MHLAYEKLRVVWMVSMVNRISRPVVMIEQGPEYVQACWVAAMDYGFGSDLVDEIRAWLGD